MNVVLQMQHFDILCLGRTMQGEAIHLAPIMLLANSGANMMSVQNFPTKSGINIHGPQTLHLPAKDSSSELYLHADDNGIY